MGNLTCVKHFANDEVLSYVTHATVYYSRVAEKR